MNKEDVGWEEILTHNAVLFSQKEGNPAFIFQIWKKKVKVTEIVEKSLSGAGECGRSGEGGKKVRTFSYKRIKIWGSNVKYGDYSW